MIPTRLPIALLVTISGALSFAPQTSERDLRPRPAPALQSAIRAVLDAPDPGARRAALDALSEGGGEHHALLVPQLLAFSQQATDTREAMALGVIAAALPIPPRDVVGALVPQLESSDAAWRAAVDGVLSEYEDRSLDRGASFSIYASYLAQEPPLGLVRHLFDVDPDAALLALARAQVTDAAELRGLLWAQHESADALWKLRFGFLAPAELARAEPEAVAQLRFLARHAHWWARLYAAAVARAQPALAALLPMDELARDGHPLVRERAAPKTR